MFTCRWGDPPSWNGWSARWGSLSILVKFCLWRKLCSIKSESHTALKGYSKPKISKWEKRSTNPAKHLCLSFCVYVLSDHSVILRKNTPRWQGCKVTCKRQVFFTPPEQVTSPTWGPPPPCKQALKGPVSWQSSSFCLILPIIHPTFTLNRYGT